MIRSDLRTVEVRGSKHVVMMELFELLKVLRGELGEKAYNLVLHDVEEYVQFKDNPEQLQERKIKEIIEDILKMMGEKADGKDEI
mgnify:CR=1 FL=1